MNRSYSKIRHMRNSNLLLERRYLVEQIIGTPPTNSLETMDSLIVGGPFKVMMGSTIDTQDKIIDSDSEKEGLYKDGNGQKHILNFTDSNIPRIETIKSITIYDQSQFSELFNPETYRSSGVLDGSKVEIRPNSKFIIWGQNAINKDCYIIYIDTSNQVQGKLITRKGE